MKTADCGKNTSERNEFFSRAFLERKSTIDVKNDIVFTNNCRGMSDLTETQRTVICECVGHFKCSLLLSTNRCGISVSKEMFSPLPLLDCTTEVKTHSHRIEEGEPDFYSILRCLLDSQANAGSVALTSEDIVSFGGQSTVSNNVQTRICCTRPPSAIEDAPSGQRFLIGSPYQLTDPVDSSSYRMDFSAPKTLYRQASLRSQSTKIDLIPGTQRTENPNPSSSREIKQALRNQLNSTYQTDFVGTLMAHSPFFLSVNSANP